MNKEEVIKVLNKLIDRIPELRKLENDNREYDSWHYEVCDTLEKLFSIDSVEYRRFAYKWRSWNQNDSEAEKKKRYIDKLDKHETDLRSIIKRFEDRPKYYCLKTVFSKRIYHELKDFTATVIAKYMKEKTE